MKPRISGVESTAPIIFMARNIVSPSTMKLLGLLVLAAAWLTSLAAEDSYDYVSYS